MRVLIRGLEAGSAYLAYLLAEAGHRVDLYTEGGEPLLDIPPFGPVFTADFLRDVLAVRFVDSPEPAGHDLVVDSCDVRGLADLRRALELPEAVYVPGDSWLSASLSLYRSLPLPDVEPAVPGETTGRYVEFPVRYRPYLGGRPLCGELRDALGGCAYTPTRALERIFLAADLFAELAGLGRPGRSVRLQYAVGRDSFYAAFGCRPEGRAARINMGDLRVTAYGEGGRIRYVEAWGSLRHFWGVLLFYGLLRYGDSAALYDVALGRGPFNVALLAHLLRGLRQLGE